MKIKHINRNETKTPTCTIQISTEYLVKESYTPEEAEKTIAQLYSLHENEGFSLEDFEKIKNEWRAHSCTEVQTVDEDDIAKVVSIWTKVPVERLTEKESDKLLHLEDILKKRIVGQEEALEKIQQAFDDTVANKIFKAYIKISQ